VRRAAARGARRFRGGLHAESGFIGVPVRVS
jgi:hypothetical protein